MNVIQFPHESARRRESHGGAASGPSASCEAGEVENACPFDETMAAALVVHNLIIEGIHDGRFHGSYPSTALHSAILEVFGDESGRWAELQFRAVYGTDPYTFLGKLLPYLQAS